MNEQNRIREFMMLAGQDCPTTPVWPAFEIRTLRHELIREELRELEIALIHGDMSQVADALADLVYVVKGAFVAFGIDGDVIFNEVHRANMSKFIDGHRREDGKWLKGPNWTPPDIDSVLMMQMPQAAHSQGICTSCGNETTRGKQVGEHAILECSEGHLWVERNIDANSHVHTQTSLL